MATFDDLRPLAEIRLSKLADELARQRMQAEEAAMADFASRGITGGGVVWAKRVSLATKQLHGLCEGRVRVWSELLRRQNGHLDEPNALHVLREVEGQAEAGVKYGVAWLRTENGPAMSERFTTAAQSAIASARRDLKEMVEEDRLASRKSAEALQSAKPTAAIPAGVFVSYSSDDADLAQALVALIGKATGLDANSIYYASHSIHPGADWFEGIMAGLRSAAVCVFLISPASRHRPWVSFEAGYFRALEGNRVALPLCVRGITQGELPAPFPRSQAYALSSTESVARVLGEICRSLGVARKEVDTEPMSRVSSLASYGGAAWNAAEPALVCSSTDDSPLRYDHALRVATTDVLIAATNMRHVAAKEHDSTIDFL